MGRDAVKREGFFEEGNLRIPFQIVRSHRRTMAIQVQADGLVVVRIPQRMSWADGERFLEREKKWAAGHSERAKRSYVKPADYTKERRREGIERAKRIFPERAEYFAGRMGVTYGRLSIREQKTRWGSCSAKGNLNFNWKLVLMPPEVLDYVVVHELAHRREMNHSPRFWAVVEAELPDYKKRREWLREHGREY